jgi:hypothetical protein
MTTLIIKSDSEEKTNLLIKFAHELGLDTESHDFKELDTEAMVKGIGRKATDEELIDYLSKDAGPFIGIEEAFAKYLDKK